MAAPTTKLYGLGMKHIATGAVDLDTDSFKLMLTTSTHTPNQDTHDFRDDVTNELAASGGYSAGGVALAGVAVTYDSASQQVRFDCNDIAFAFTASKTWRNAHLYKSRGGASSADELVGYLVWDSDQSVSTTYTLVIDPAGLLFFDVT
jgi:hypothetical protein